MTDIKKQMNVSIETIKGGVASAADAVKSAAEVAVLQAKRAAHDVRQAVKKAGS